MGGAFILTLSRATVAEHRDGVPTGTRWGPGTVTIRDGVASLRVNDLVAQSMPATTYAKTGRGTYEVPHSSDEHTMWLVTRKGG